MNVSPTTARSLQVYIEKEIYKRKPQPIDKQTSVVVGGGGGAAGAGGREAATAGFAAPPEAAVAVEAAAEAARLGLGWGADARQQ